jgi:hypothetical protein
MDIVVSVGSDGELIVSSVENIDVTTEIHGKAGLTYAELRELVNVESYVFGNPVDALIEMMNAESQEYASMTGEETELTEGLYRAKYERKTDTGYSQGYIYFQLLLDVVEKPEETPEIKDENPEESVERPEEQGTA